MPTMHRPSLAVRRALIKLGKDINVARRRRGLPMEVLASRAFTTRQTLQKVEAGNAMVAVGIYAAVLQGLGMLDAIADLADAANDKLGLDLAEDHLPKRVRLRSPNRKRAAQTKTS